LFIIDYSFPDFLLWALKSVHLVLFLTFSGWTLSPDKHNDTIFFFNSTLIFCDLFEWCEINRSNVTTTRCQFHQHLRARFLYEILAPKPKHNLKSCQKGHFVQKICMFNVDEIDYRTIFRTSMEFFMKDSMRSTFIL